MKGFVFCIWTILGILGYVPEVDLGIFLRKMTCRSLLAHVGGDILQISQILVEWEDLKSSTKKNIIDCNGYFWNASSFYPLIKEHITRWWFHRFLIFTPTWRWSNLTNIFQMGWFNHQPDQYEMKKDLVQNKLSTSYQRCVVTMVYWRGTSEARRIVEQCKPKIRLLCWLFSNQIKSV